MKRLIIGCMVGLIVCGGALGQGRSSRNRGSAQGSGEVKVEELSVYPSKVVEKDSRLLLLPDADNLSDNDAVKLYDKAVEAMPKKGKEEEIVRWVKSPLDELPVKQVEAALEPYQQSLQLLDEAANCKQCNWPSVKALRLPRNQKEYRTLAQVLAVKARLQIVRGQYDEAVGTIRTGLSMGRNLGGSLTLAQGLVGIAISSLMLEPTKELIQVANGPNLYSAFNELPRPLVDVNEALDAEMENIDNEPFLRRWQMRKILTPAHERTRQLMKRLDRNIAALQVIEALRLYAGENGMFSKSLEQMKGFQLPLDPVTEKPFEYTGSGSEASLKGPIPKGGSHRDAIYYKLKLQQKE